MLNYGIVIWCYLYLVQMKKKGYMTDVEIQELVDFLSISKFNFRYKTLDTSVMLRIDEVMIDEKNKSFKIIAIPNIIYPEFYENNLDTIPLLKNIKLPFSLRRSLLRKSGYMYKERVEKSFECIKRAIGGGIDIANYNEIVDYTDFEGMLELKVKNKSYTALGKFKISDYSKSYSNRWDKKDPNGIMSINFNIDNTSFKSEEEVHAIISEVEEEQQSVINAFQKDMIPDLESLDSHLKDGFKPGKFLDHIKKNVPEDIFDIIKDVNMGDLENYKIKLL